MYVPVIVKILLHITLHGCETGETRFEMLLTNVALQSEGLANLVDANERRVPNLAQNSWKDLRKRLTMKTRERRAAEVGDVAWLNKPTTRLHTRVSTGPSLVMFTSHYEWYFHTIYKYMYMYHRIIKENVRRITVNESDRVQM